MSTAQLNITRNKVLKTNMALEQALSIEYSEALFKDKDKARSLYQKFMYCLAKNKRLLENEVESINTARKPSQQYQKFVSERSELAMKYTNVDKEGNPLVLGRNLVIQKRRDEFEEELEKLKNTYREAISEREEQENGWEDFGNSEVEITIYKIKFDYIPVTLTGILFEALMPLLQEDDDEIENKM